MYRLLTGMLPLGPLPYICPLYQWWGCLAQVDELGLPTVQDVQERGTNLLDRLNDMAS
jgi:hypothetical protein